MPASPPTGAAIQGGNCELSFEVRFSMERDDSTALVSPTYAVMASDWLMMARDHMASKI